jgi:NADH:ubiquinone oxidoreductase subunit 2 (subunit N)
VVNTVVSLVYYLRVLAPSYNEALAAPVPVLGQWARTATLACGLGVIALGIGAGPFLDALGVSVLLPG